MTPADLDAVTIDAYGTLVELDRPVRRLRAALAARGAERDEDAVGRALGAEIAYYRAHKLEGADAASLARLRRRCAGVFVEALGCPELEFADDFLAALVFAPLPGVVPALERLRAHGLALAVVSNWDVGLHEHLRAIGLAAYFDAVVSSAEAGAEKPDAAPFRLALELLGVEPGRVLHVGDDDADRHGAAAAGMLFARAPLAGAVAA